MSGLKLALRAPLVGVIVAVAVAAGSDVELGEIAGIRESREGVARTRATSGLMSSTTAWESSSIRTRTLPFVTKRREA